MASGTPTLVAKCRPPPTVMARPLTALVNLVNKGKPELMLHQPADDVMRYADTHSKHIKISSDDMSSS